MQKKSNLAVMALSSVVCLLPLILALAVYDDLPAQMAIHWDTAGNQDNFASKAAAAFGVPLLFMAINIVSKLFLYNDPKSENTAKPMRTIVEWIIPFLSLVIVPIMLFIAMGVKLPIVIIVMVFTGIIIILFGNYLPKNRQNYVIGIRLPWTLNDADNWNMTHRMAGPLFIFSGMALIIVSFLPLKTSLQFILIMLILTLIAAVPILYSYSLYRRNAKKTENTRPI